MTKKFAYGGGHFGLSLEHLEPVYLKSAEGGAPQHEVLSERFGEAPIAITHASTASISDLKFEIGLSGAEEVLKWIKGSWNKQYGRRSGLIDFADANMDIKYSYEFGNALIAETTFPALSGDSKEGGYLKVKITPESGAYIPDRGGKLQYRGGASKQKLWLCSSFRFTVDGVDGFQYTNKIESFTVKQGIKKLHTGEERYQELMPTKVEFPQIVGNIAEGYADKIKKWADEYIRRGRRDPKAQHSGSLEFLAPDKKTVLFRINMYQITLAKLEQVPVVANQNEIHRLKYTLQVERMELDGRFGFD